VLFIDAIHVKVRDGQVTNRPFYVVIGVTVDGHRDILGIWAGDGGEGAKYWLHVLTEIKNRGVTDACIVVCDGLKGLPESITTVWPQALVQACVLHLIRNTFRYASRKYWEQMARGPALGLPVTPTCSMPAGDRVCSHDLPGARSGSLRLHLSPFGVDSPTACVLVGAAGGSGSREVCTAQSWSALLAEHPAIFPVSRRSECRGK
jgi:hypothetical protein